MFSGFVKWLLILVEVLKHAFSMGVIAPVRGQKLVLGGGGKGFQKPVHLSKMCMHTVRASCIICNALCQMKMQGTVFKSRERVPLKILKYMAFSFCLHSSSLLVMVFICCVMPLKIKKKEKFKFWDEFLLHLYIVQSPF